MTGSNKDSMLQETESIAAGQGLAPVAGSSSGVLSLPSKMEGLGISKPFSNQILLFDGAYVAGTTHVKNLDEMLESTQVGDRLEFQRDPENIYDEWAVKVMLPGKGRIGFVPADLNQVIARLMDGGKCVFGVITDIELLGAWTKISIEVYLDD